MTDQGKGSLDRRTFLRALGATSLVTACAADTGNDPAASEPTPSTDSDTSGPTSPTPTSTPEGARSTAAGNRPLDILFILTDDQRADTLGITGNPFVATPNLDSLARDGTLFRENFVTTSICPTSRISILLGEYASHHQNWGFIDPLTPDQLARTYPSLLQGAGYRTGFVGKWGIGGPLPATGFHSFEGFAGQGEYYADADGEHLTRQLGDAAVDFFDTVEPDEPFCLSVSFKAPHNQADRPWWVPIPEMAAMYADFDPTRPANGGDDSFEALPPVLQDPDFFGRGCWEWSIAPEAQYAETIRGYYALISGVDQQVGRLVARLKDIGRYETTLIVFTSDNGLFLGEHGLCGKWLMHEESIRTPMIIRNPSLPESVGTEVADMTLNIDVMPTLLDAAGVAAPATVDGRSLLPLMTPRAHPDWRSDWFYEHRLDNDRIPAIEGVRSPRWKYIAYVDTDPVQEELFDLAADPAENVNLIDEPRVAGTAAQLRDRHQTYVSELHP